MSSPPSLNDRGFDDFVIRKVDGGDSPPPRAPNEGFRRGEPQMKDLGESGLQGGTENIQGEKISVQNPQKSISTLQFFKSSYTNSNQALLRM